MELLDITQHPWIYHTIYATTRWLHLVATALLVGGILFYEFVIPAAIDELKDEHQLAIFGRVRFYFAGVVGFSAFVLLGTGVLSLYRHWDSYFTHQEQAWPWALAHTILAVVAILIAVRLVFRPAMPPLSWMRVNLIILLVVIFLATTSRHVRIFLRERQDAELRAKVSKVEIDPSSRNIRVDPASTQGSDGN